MIGFVFGFLGSMPVAGPIAAIVFSRAVAGRVRTARAVAIGASFPEAFYAALAFWGFGELLLRNAWLQTVSNVIAALILGALGIFFLLYKHSDVQLSEAKGSARKGFALGFTIAALNPALIGAWAAAVTTLYSLELIQPEPGTTLPFSVGVFLGISAWFLLLVEWVDRFRGRFNYAVMTRVIRVLGVLFIAGSAAFAWRLF